MKRFSLFLALLIGIGVTTYAQDPDTSKVRIGNKQYTIIIDSDKEVRILTEDDVIVNERVHKRKRMHRMHGTWDGFEIGLNHFVNSDFDLNYEDDPEAAFMELRVPNSYNLNFNFCERTFGLIGDYFGITTGLGFEYNRYMLSEDVSIMEVDEIMVGVPTDHDLKKNRFSAWYLNIPLLAEIHIPVTGESKRLHLSGGIIGGMRMCSRQVQKYYINDDKHKNKAKGDFNLRNFRYGFTARAGYDGFSIYANYYPQTLFAEGMGPEIFPVMIGLHFGDF